MADKKSQSELRYSASVGIHALLTLCGSNPDTDGLKDTPKRVIKAFEEQTSGYKVDPAKILLNAGGELTFDEQFDEMIVLRDIEFNSLCEHHLLPFFGTATVGYIPNGKGVVGVSKLARLVDCFAKRFQVQERMTNQIADALEEHLKAIGVGVIVQAKHQCMMCRGVQKSQPVMVTSVVRGLMKTDDKARAEFLSFK